MDKKQIFENALENYMEQGGDFTGNEYAELDEQAMFLSFWIGVEYMLKKIEGGI